MTADGKQHPHRPQTSAEARDELEHFDAVAAAEELRDALGDTDRSGGRSGDSYTEILESEVERLTALADEKDRAARRAAVEARQAREDVDRAGERIRKEARKEVEGRTRTLLRSFLEVLDNLDRALHAARSDKAPPALLEGLELVRSEFLRKLAEHQVQHVPALGQVFDPSLHEAVSVVPIVDPRQHGRVLGVMKEGYVIGAESLRPAQVAVGKMTS